MGADPSKARGRDWDVVIVDATGKLGEHGYPLRTELVRRGLRVKLDIVPAMRVSSIPAEVFGDSEQAAYCVALMTVQMESEDRPGVSIEMTAFVGGPAPGGPGCLAMAMFAPDGSGGAAVYAETGRLPRDLEGLADRIAARIRPFSK